MINFLKGIIDQKFKQDQKDNAYEELLSIERYKPTTVKLFGKEYLVADALSFYYSYKEIFNEKIYLFKSITNNPFIVDCGANYGTSIVYFKKLYPESTIHAFEADPTIFSILKRNVEEFQLQNVFTYNNALWHEDSIVEFESEGADSGRISVNDATNNTSKIKVKTKLLSTIIKDKPISFLKVDIEGAELNVLYECEKYLNNVQNIFIEYHSFINQPQRLDELLLILKKAGFRYQIKTQMVSTLPYINIDTYNGMDLQLNIFGYRNKGN